MFLAVKLHFNRIGVNILHNDDIFAEVHDYMMTGAGDA